MQLESPQSNIYIESYDKKIEIYAESEFESYPKLTLFREIPILSFLWFD